MTSETKKLIESVTIFSQHDVSCSGGLTEWVNKSDFDRVFKELTKQIKLEREKALRFAEFTSIEQWEFCSFSDGLFWMPINGETLVDGRKSTSELYTSKEFEQYFNGLKKVNR